MVVVVEGMGCAVSSLKVTPFLVARLQNSQTINETNLFFLSAGFQPKM